MSNRYTTGGTLLIIATGHDKQGAPKEDVKILLKLLTDAVDCGIRKGYTKADTQHPDANYVNVSYWGHVFEIEKPLDDKIISILQDFTSVKVARALNPIGTVDSIHWQIIQ